MALNKWMHPRNPYKDSKPDFKRLAAEYPEFKKHTTTDNKGKVHLDFKNPECLRALTSVLLKRDFSLTLDLPPDRLVPTIPLRLNYILWLEDILGAGSKSDTIHAIDIGTGASCIYPLLGAKKNNWQFMATEADPTNYEYAQKNVSSNSLTQNIAVKSVGEDSMLCDIFQDGSFMQSFDFCMCNPPFFGSNMEAWGMLSSRSNDRPEPMSVSTASPQESIVPGGEIQFVKNMIADSLVLKDKIKVYTTMLGKKASVPVLKQELHQHNIKNVGTTEFCQGRTMRWGLAWSFNPSVVFPKPASKTSPCKAKPALIHTLPSEMVNVPGVNYTIQALSQVLVGLCEKLKVVVKEKFSSKTFSSWEITAYNNTWSHQRRKRRHQQHLQTNHNNSQSEQTDSLDTYDTVSAKRTCVDSDAFQNSQMQITTELNESHISSSEQLHNGDGDTVTPGTSDGHCGDSQKNPILKAEFMLRQRSDEIVLEVKCDESQKRETLHQVLQYFKNQLK